MARRLKFDIPGVDWRLSPEQLDAAGLDKAYPPELPRPLRLVVDLGFGRGEFLAGLARERRDTAFLGVEYSFKRVLKLARRLARSDLENVRLVEATAQQVVGEQLPDAAVDCFWINFPDPWPKKRHHRRRLIQPAFALSLARCLAPGGRLHVATDHQEYAEHIGDVLEAEPRLVNLLAPAPFRSEVDDRPPTAYELEWRAEGRSFCFFSYGRREAAGGAGPGEPG